MNAHPAPVFSGALWTTKRFVHFARAHCEGAKKAPVLVNISSLAALVPFPSMANYCAAKAAKDAFTKVVGAEHTGGASIIHAHVVRAVRASYLPPKP
jgi:NAD(P)-dependent dehydrogenase (short-subunit alcohol dehydrogenase family)